MDTPESPTQSPQSPEEEYKGLSDSELLDSADEGEERVISGSKVVFDEDNDGLDEEDKEEETVENRGRHSVLEEEREEDHEVVPDFVSDAEDEETVGETGVMGHEDETIMLMEGDEDGPQGEQIDGEEEEDRVIDTPQSPDSEPEQVRRFIAGEDREDRYGYYRKDAFAEPETAEVDDDEEEEDESKVEEDKRVRSEEEERRRAVMVREMDDDSASVSRELDEHELDYDEEVPEEPSIPPHEEEEDEEDAKVEGEEEEERDKSSKKEKKPILPPSPKDSDCKRTDDGKGPERVRRDSFRDKNKDEDDGEIDEGEIDVSDSSAIYSYLLLDSAKYSFHALCTTCQ